MNLDISVIVCCHNSASRLPETLRHLALQCTQEVYWELVLVNNGSNDNTVGVATEIWNKLGVSVPLIVVEEDTLGLSFARKKGIEVSKGSLIIFCDDDNWLADDYISRVNELFQSSRYRLVGGWGIPVSDGPFPDWFIRLQGYGYAVGKQGRTTGEGYAVQGAGMAIRKSDALVLLDDRYDPFLSDRKGKSLSTGGDAEISTLIGGVNRFFDESLIYHHYLPVGRLKLSYFENLNYYIGVSDSYLFFYKLIGDHFYLALKKYIHKIYSSVKVLIRLSNLNFSRNVSIEERIALRYQKGFTMFLIRNVFQFRKCHLQAKNNALLFKLSSAK